MMPSQYNTFKIDTPRPGHNVRPRSVRGTCVTFLRTDGTGCIDLMHLEEVIRARPRTETGLISLMYVSPHGCNR